MTNDKNKKSSELGPRRSDVTAEKSFSEVVDGDDENRPRDVAEVLHYEASFDSGGSEVNDGARPLRTAARGNGQVARIASAAEAYACDRGTVRVLALTQLAAGDRSAVDAWLDKLDGCGDAEVRSQYVALLLRTVAGGSIRAKPFWGRPPPDGPLKQLGPALLQLQHSGPAPARSYSAPRRAMPTTPGQTFYSHQPIPEDGTFCYAAAFSDMF